MIAGLEPAELPADAVEVGTILDAWGIKGWFKVSSYSASPEALFSSKRWYLMPAEKGPRGFSGVALLRISTAREHSEGLVASAQEFTDRSQAEILRGARIFIPRSSFPTPDTDEFYWVDLIGLEIVNREGLSLGRVKDFLATGPQTVMVVSFEQQGKQSERMIPFVSAYVDAVDLAARRITVDWQPDYL